MLIKTMYNSELLYIIDISETIKIVKHCNQMENHLFFLFAFKS